LLVTYSDPFGLCPVCLVVWGAYEIGSGIYDAYQAYKTVASDASTGEKVATVAMAAGSLFLPGGGYTALDDLAGAAKVLDKGGELTRAGRSLEKHGSRPGSAFPSARGNAAAKNSAGQHVVEDILTDPNSRRVPLTTGRFKGGFDVYAGDGRGVRYDGKGNFVGLLEPPRK
jgi:hypothetical protein